MLDYRIHTFLTLYEQMNYRKTAEMMLMTQPGVTQHIHYLENYYGVKLFTYDGKTLSRTRQADILKQHLVSIMEEEKEIFEAFSKPEKTVLHIGATKTIGEFVLLPVIREFLKDRNHVIHLTIDNTAHLLRMLDEAKLDFAVIEGVFDKEKYPCHLYKKEDFVGICSRSHRFAGKTVPFKELFSEHLILRERGSGTRGLFERALQDNGYTLDSFDRVTSVGNFSVITQMVAEDQAITFAYKPVAESRDELSLFRVTDLTIRGEFNFVYCNERIAKEKISLLFSGDGQNR